MGQLSSKGEGGDGQSIVLNSSPEQLEHFLSENFYPKSIFREIMECEEAIFLYRGDGEGAVGCIPVLNWGLEYREQICEISVRYDKVQGSCR